MSSSSINRDGRGTSTHEIGSSVVGLRTSESNPSETDRFQTSVDMTELEFREIFMSLAPRVLRFIAPILRDKHLAEDVAQESFIKLYHAIRAGRVDAERDLSSLVMTIARHTALDMLRRHQKIKVLIESADIDSIGPDTGPDDREFRRNVNDALNSLAPEQQMLITLRYVEKLKLKALAEIFECTERTAHNRLKTAARRFQRELQRHGIFSISVNSDLEEQH